MVGWTGLRSLAAGAVFAALAGAASNGWSQNQQGPRPAQIDRNGTLILIRETLIALQQANETGNYTVLRDLGAPGFHDVNDAARLSEIFANLRRQKLDLAGILVLEPQLTVLPEIEANGLMRMAGFFPSVPTQINFELAYAPVDGRWRPYGISVGLGSSSPVAPSPPAPAATAAVKLQKPNKVAGKTKSGAGRPSKKSSESKPQPKSPETNTAPEPDGGASLDEKH